MMVLADILWSARLQELILSHDRRVWARAKGKKQLIRGALQSLKVRTGNVAPCCFWLQAANGD